MKYLKWKNPGPGRKFGAFMLSLLLLCMPVSLSALAQSTEATVPDISKLSVEQLQTLEKAVQQRLTELGAAYVQIVAADTGEQVGKLQNRLKELGYYDGKITNKWDKASVSAMKTYEKAAGLKPDGIADVEEQEVLYTDQAIAKPTPAPTATPKPSPTPDPRKAYGKFNFKQYSRNPENYPDAKVKISGYVLQVMGDKTSTQTLRVATSGHWNNIIMLYVLPGTATGFNILEDDKITAYCTMSGLTSYETVLGATITLPEGYVDTLELR